MSEAARGCSCGAVWGGHSTCHCPTCHRTFSSISGFDRHRVQGTCLDPSLLDYERDARGIWRRKVSRSIKRAAFRSIKG